MNVGTRRGSSVKGVAPARGRDVVRVAAFRSLETKLLSRDLGFDVAVIAVVDDPEVHAAWLSRRWYGALRVRSNWLTAWDTWNAMPWTTRYEPFGFDERWRGGSPLPSHMAIVDGSLEVVLPPGGGRAAFEAAFRAGMADRQFDVLAKAPSAVAHRFRTGRPLEIGARYGSPPWGSIKPIIVDDLYGFRPRGFRSVVRRAADALMVVGIRSALSASAEMQVG